MGSHPREGQETPALSALLGQCSERGGTPPPPRVCVCVHPEVGGGGAATWWPLLAERWVGARSRGGGNGMGSVRVMDGARWKVRLDTATRVEFAVIGVDVNPM